MPSERSALLDASTWLPLSLAKLRRTATKSAAAGWRSAPSFIQDTTSNVGDDGDHRGMGQAMRDKTNPTGFRILFNYFNLWL